MTPEAQARKLLQIARLSVGELDGWEAQIATDPARPFEGERAAIVARRKALGVGR